MEQIFQGFEPAHWLVYGSALVPPEFMPSIALRSPLKAMLYGALMWIGSALHLDYHMFILPFLRLTHIFVATTAVYQLYRFTRFHLHDDRWAGRVAALLAAVNPLLIRAEIMSVANSFWSPFLLAAATAFLTEAPAVRPSYCAYLYRLTLDFLIFVVGS